MTGGQTRYRTFVAAIAALTVGVAGASSQQGGAGRQAPAGATDQRKSGETVQFQTAPVHGNQ